MKQLVPADPDARVADLRQRLAVAQRSLVAHMAALEGREQEVLGWLRVAKQRPPNAGILILAEHVEALLCCVEAAGLLKYVEGLTGELKHLEGTDSTNEQTDAN